MNQVEYLIAKRFLRSKRKVRFVNVISIISVVGITVGVAALLIVLSVFNGFQEVVTGVLVGFDPHIRIEKRGGLTAEDVRVISDVLKSEKNVTAYSPFVAGKAMVLAKSYNRVVFLRGVDQDKIAEVSGLKDRLSYGSMTLSDSAGPDGMLVGLSLADHLGAITGSALLVVSPEGLQSAMSAFGTPQTMKFNICGIFESNNRDYDGNYAYISLASAQRLFLMKGKYSGIDLRLTDFHLAETEQSQIQKRMPEGVTVSTWYDLHKSLYTVMLVERWSSYILLSLIVAVATFNMLGSLSMSIIEKQRDIGVLRAMGMPSKGIVRIFMVEGMLIGMLGTACGFALGTLVVWLQGRYGFFALDTNVYIIPAIPVQMRLSDFIAVAVSSLGLSSIAAWYPARRAGRALPAESLRWE